MAWQNAFALGACTVQVLRGFGQFGDTTLIPPSEYEAEGISVEVSSAGVVTMTAPDIGGSGYRYDVRVVPSYPTQGRSVRLVGAATPDEGPDYSSPIWSAGAVEEPPPFEPFPDPFEFTPKGPWAWAGFMAGRSGI